MLTNIHNAWRGANGTDIDTLIRKIANNPHPVIKHATGNRKGSCVGRARRNKMLPPTIHINQATNKDSKVGLYPLSSTQKTMLLSIKAVASANRLVSNQDGKLT